MVKHYGIIGLATIVFAEIALFFKWQPFTSFFCPLVWLGYILVVDSLVHLLKKNSLLTRHPKKLLTLFVISFVFWTIFELYNRFIPGWQYLNIHNLEVIAGVIAFSTILPAILETFELIRSLHLFDRFKGPNVNYKKIINKNLLQLSIAVGALFLVLPFFFSGYWWSWAMVWTGFFFFLDPINYLNGQPSVFGDLKHRKWVIPLSLVLAGLICGFLWEFWNWGAVARWQYTLPNVPLANIKIFEMPILGYLGYPPFALELYAMYYFVKFLFGRGEKIKI
jgi:hypothetical protein